MKYFNAVLLIVLICLTLFFNLGYDNTVVVEHEVIKEVEVKQYYSVNVPYRLLTDYSYVSPITAEEAIEIIKEAQNTHDYFVHVQPEDVAFHALWVERYEQLIELIISYEGD